MEVPRNHQPTIMSIVTKCSATLAMLAALAAAGISGYLAYQSWQGSTAVCTADAFDCDTVLTSNWSRLWGQPVAAVGAAVYLAIAVLAWPAAIAGRGGLMNALVTLAAAAVGAALWFTSLQWLELQSFCSFCLTVHGCGLVVTLAVVGLAATAGEGDAKKINTSTSQSIPALVSSRRESSYAASLAWSMAIGLAAVAALIGVQTVAGDGATQALEEIELPPSGSSPEVADDETRSDDDVNDAASPSDEEAGPEKRLLSIAALAKPLDLSTVPVLGDPEAPYVVVEMLDYGCAHCRRLHPRLLAARERYGDQLAVALMPAPLHSDCNDQMPPGRKGRQYACDYAKLALAVWRLAPEEFESYHNWLMTGRLPPPIGEARQRAMDIAGQRVLIDERLEAQSVRMLRRNTAAWIRIDESLPLLLFPESALRGGGASDQEFFDTLEQKLGIEPVTGE